MKYGHEIVLPNEDLPFKMFLFEGEQGNYVREKHWHGSLEIFAIFEGSLRFFLHEKEYLLKAGEFIIVNSNEVHSVFSPKPNRTVVIQIPMSVFGKYYLKENFICFSHEPSVRDDELMQLIREMYQAYVNKKCGYEFLVKSAYYNLLYMLITEYRVREVSPELVKNYRKLNRLSDITDYIKENYATELSLESLAERFGYSPTHLSKMFQKYAKIQYREYVQSIRLEYAYPDIVKTDCMLHEIAEKHGFSNSKALAKAFEKTYGMLPSEYRRKMRKE